jgi:hypothetical protein
MVQEKSDPEWAVLGAQLVERAQAHETALLCRVRKAFADVQHLLRGSFFFDVTIDNSITTEDGRPALLTLESHGTRGNEDPNAFTVRLNINRHIEAYGANPSGAQLRANALHEILHAFRQPADILGEYRLRAAERVAHLSAQEAAVYAEERAFVPLIEFWLQPWPKRVWNALVRTSPTIPPTI